MLMFDRERSSRIGVLRKDASSELGIRWFKLPAMYAYHVANAWQERGDNGWIRIRIFLCVYDDSVCALYTASAGPHRQCSKVCNLLRRSHGNLLFPTNVMGYRPCTATYLTNAWQ